MQSLSSWQPLGRTARAGASGSGARVACILASITRRCRSTSRHWCWGLGADGELGTGGFSSSDVPVAVAGNLAFGSLSVNPQGRFACGLTPDTHTYCWGANDQGQLGDGTTAPRPAPTLVAGDPAFTTISAGARHTCGLAGGQAYCWGDNSNGQLGQAGATTVPGVVVGGLAFASLAAGSEYTCGLTPGGQAYCWGLNGIGQLGNGTTAAAAAPTQVSGNLTFASLTASEEHTCGVASDQVAYCWGGGEGVGSYSVPTYVPVRVLGQP
jgi:alpha-tubulin suppressor-like RCC1 family protein